MGHVTSFGCVSGRSVSPHAATAHSECTAGSPYFGQACKTLEKWQGTQLTGLAHTSQINTSYTD